MTEQTEALERLWMARDLTHPDAMIMWYDIIHTSLTQSAARIAELEAQLARAEEVINALWRYGQLHTVEGVIYPGGTHAEVISAAAQWIQERDHA